MRIVKSVIKAISEWQSGDSESAMLHACNAINGTANKAYSGMSGDKARFVKLLRDNYSILGPMGMPSVDLDITRFGVDLKKPSEQISDFDLAELIYKIHRCSHGHGDEVLEGFELIPDAAGPHGTTHFSIDVVDGTVQLSDRIIFGMLGVVVFSPVNSNQTEDCGSCFLTYDGIEFPINEWWGRAYDFLKIVEEGRRSTVTIYEVISEDPAPVRTSGDLHFKLLGKPI